MRTASAKGESQLDERLLWPEAHAAKMLSVSPRTLFAYRTAGRIPFLKIGGRVLYSPAALAAWVESQLTTTADADTEAPAA